MSKVMRLMAMLSLHKAEEHTTCTQVDLKQDFQKCSFYRKKSITADRQQGFPNSSIYREQPIPAYTTTTTYCSTLARRIRPFQLQYPEIFPVGKFLYVVTAGAYSLLALMTKRGLCPFKYKPMRVIEVSMEQRRNERAGKREIPEKIRRPTASSGTITTRENPENERVNIGTVYKSLFHRVDDWELSACPRVKDVLYRNNTLLVAWVEYHVFSQKNTASFAHVRPLQRMAQAMEQLKCTHGKDIFERRLIWKVSMKRVTAVQITVYRFPYEKTLRVVSKAAAGARDLICSPTSQCPLTASSHSAARAFLSPSRISTQMWVWLREPLGTGLVSDWLLRAGEWLSPAGELDTRRWLVGSGAIVRDCSHEARANKGIAFTSANLLVEPRVSRKFIQRRGRLQTLVTLSYCCDWTTVLQTRPVWLWASDKQEVVVPVQRHHLTTAANKQTTISRVYIGLTSLACCQLYPRNTRGSNVWLWASDKQEVVVPVQRHHLTTAANKQTTISRVYRGLSSLACCQLYQRNTRGSNVWLWASDKKEVVVPVQRHHLTTAANKQTTISRVYIGLTSLACCQLYPRNTRGSNVWLWASDKQEVVVPVQRHHLTTAANKQTTISRVYRELSSLACCQLYPRNTRGSNVWLWASDKQEVVVPVQRHHLTTAANKQTTISRVYRELSSLACCQLYPRNTRGSNVWLWASDKQEVVVVHTESQSVMTKNGVESVNTKYGKSPYSLWLRVTGTNNADSTRSFLRHYNKEIIIPAAVKCRNKKAVVDAEAESNSGREGAISESARCSREFPSASTPHHAHTHIRYYPTKIRPGCTIIFPEKSSNEIS
ncbi:hypothetical protein PR048_010758 [Dryococelus australis]|uniref:Uncharacterized protein n=1 Tax=Dryococelus australis TaxID=614101 RepID=A0ABQ9I3L6_9NEOP|nr:hypothetical protein PR048_010758 [Dryococelus australis]